MVDILGGRHLVTRKGAAVEAEAALQNKVVALYFAAARCGLSRDFTQLLCDFYTALVAEARRPAPFEVVFVSADDSSQEMLSFMHELHGTWLALPFHDPYRHNSRSWCRECRKPWKTAAGLANLSKHKPPDLGHRPSVRGGETAFLMSFRVMLVLLLLGPHVVPDSAGQRLVHGPRSADAVEPRGAQESVVS
ncbi:nucleoredoxin-like protein 2 isoform X1 [Piliocolobus tephrosceles]|uniref:nucleoredoxin-like protein 2 isoform X1 n=1 Tax=Piliocolobus tephrosceles TaxID=591936 RepID=UPI000C2AFCFE|nr:nucleoredoxin-like protein 2 isoform X1 [Piliocolobus tephrosceles]